MKENRMYDPGTREVRSAQVPADLAASVAAKNASRLEFTAEEREAAERKLAELGLEIR